VAGGARIASIDLDVDLRVAAQKLASRGMNSSLAKNGGSNTRSVCLPLRRAICARLRSSASRSGSTSSSSVCPTVVNSSARVLRSNRRTPSASSSSFIWWLTADGVRNNSSAAALKLRWRAAAQNARRFLSGGGRDRRIVEDAPTVSSMRPLCKIRALKLQAEKTAPVHTLGPQTAGVASNWTQPARRRTDSAQVSQ